MKRLFLMLALVLCGCNAQQGQLLVQQTFPGGELQAIPGDSYRWIVKTTNGEIYYAQCWGVTVQTNILFWAK